MILLWPLAFAILSLPLFHAPSNRLLELAVENRAILTGGCLFMMGGLLGETLKARLSGGHISPAGLFAVTFLWWLCGAFAAIVFPLINMGVTWSQTLGLLPGGGFGSAPNPLVAIVASFFFATPFFTSVLLNFMAAPLWMLRRVILSAASHTPPYFWPGADATLNRAVKSVNWSVFAKSEAWQIPCLRIPLLTLVIMMPEKYWLYLSAWLIIVVIMIGNLGGRRRI